MFVMSCFIDLNVKKKTEMLAHWDASTQVINNTYEFVKI